LKVEVPTPRRFEERAGVRNSSKLGGIEEGGKEPGCSFEATDEKGGLRGVEDARAMVGKRKCACSKEVWGGGGGGLTRGASSGGRGNGLLLKKSSGCQETEKNQRHLAGLGEKKLPAIQSARAEPPAEPKTTVIGKAHLVKQARGEKKKKKPQVRPDQREVLAN